MIIESVIPIQRIGQLIYKKRSPDKNALPRLPALPAYYSYIASAQKHARLIAAIGRIPSATSELFEHCHGFHLFFKFDI